MGVIGWIYDVVHGKELHAEYKRLNPRGPKRKKHHQYFSDELRGLTHEDLVIVKALSDRKEPFQLGLTG